MRKASEGRDRAGAGWSAWFDGLHSARRHDRTRRWMVRAKHFVDRRLDRPVPIAAMAAEACVSKYHFIRAFRRIFRETPGRYVTYRRIARARELLERTDLPVTAISFEVGFESLGSFISRFKQVVGEPPGSYRRRFARHGPVVDRPLPACLYHALAGGTKAGDQTRGRERNSEEAVRPAEGHPEPSLRNDGSSIMIRRLSHVTIFVADQDRAKHFYAEKLGMEVRTDQTVGGFRWLTVGPTDQPDLELVLVQAGPPMHDDATAARIRELLEGGALGAGVFETDDCRQTYEELRGRGVEFLSAPRDRPYGVEATFRDDSGNWFSLTQR